MEPILAFVIGAVFTAAVYLILRRSIMKLVVGLMLISNAANLMIFTVAGVTEGAPPLIGDDGLPLVNPATDPLPQALILTAIVISFAILAFSVVLINRTYEITGIDDLDKMRSTDLLEEER